MHGRDLHQESLGCAVVSGLPAAFNLFHLTNLATVENLSPRFGPAKNRRRFRPYVGEKVLEIGARQAVSLLVPRQLYWASDISPFLKNLGANRPYMGAGYTDGEKGHSFPKEQSFDTVSGAGGRARTLGRAREPIAHQRISRLISSGGSFSSLPTILLILFRSGQYSSEEAVRRRVVPILRRRHGRKGKTNHKIESHDWSE